MPSFNAAVSVRIIILVNVCNVGRVGFTSIQKMNIVSTKVVSDE